MQDIPVAILQPLFGKEIGVHFSPVEIGFDWLCFCRTLKAHLSS
jgi:hypothetical protein